MLNFVTESPRTKWIMYYFCEELAKRLPSKISEDIDNDYEANLFFPYYYSDYYEFKKIKKMTPAIGVFTHQEAREKFEQAAKRVDWCIAMCDLTAELLPKHKTSIIHFPPVQQYYRGPVTIGVAGKDTTGRKRFELVERMRQLPGIEVDFTNGMIPYGQMPTWYDDIDYLVVTADNEGGPMPVVEALARGKPVIAPHVGFAWDYPVIRYETPEQLLEIVSKLYIDPKTEWDRAAKQVLGAVERAKEVYGSLT